MNSRWALKKRSGYTPPKGPVVLLILDGVGMGKSYGGNAVATARMPVLNDLFKLPTFRLLKAHGTAVGMPSDEDMGNSEVGHNALGAGRIFDQGAKRVESAIRSSAVFAGETWPALINNAVRHQSTLHFVGLLSDGNVHAHIDHLLAMIHRAAAEGIKKVRIHILTDGRDVAAKSALHYIDRLESALAKANQTTGNDYRIASGGGRMVITMDRYNADWTMVERGWRTHIQGQARQFGSARQAVEIAYAEDARITDQYIPPFVIAENGSPIGRIEDGDSVILFNFRGDRAIELSLAFESDTFTHFDRGHRPKVKFAGMMRYDGDLQVPTHYLVDPPAIDRSVSHHLCASGIHSFAISETQKYGHVTYFWNGNRSGYVDKTMETYIEIPSYMVPFDEIPEMRAPEIAEKTIELVRSGRYQFGRVNFPNGDMVGHTGNFGATVRSMEALDRAVGDVVAAVTVAQGITIILADHGNAEQMWTETNGVRSIKTAHTLNPVPFVIIDPRPNPGYHLATGMEEAGLANVAATLCSLLGLVPPPDFAPALIVP